MKTIFVLLLIALTQNLFGQEKPNYICSDCKSIPEPLSVPKPQFPEEAKLSEISGKVKVQVSIDEQGNVIEAKLIEGNKIFEENAIKAAMLAKFKPAKYFATEEAAKSFGVIVFNFILPKDRIIITAEFPQKIIISSPKPEYPESAKFVNASGEVSVEVIVDENGNVESAKAVSGHVLLRPTSEKAAFLAKFKPTYLSGKPVRVRTFITYNFVSDKIIETKTNDKEIILGSPLKLLKPPFPSFSGKIGSKRPQVFVQIEIDENGNVISAQGIAGHPVLRAACETAARSSKFSQTKISGVSVKAKAILLYEYNLEDDTKTVEVKSIEAIKPN